MFTSDRADKITEQEIRSKTYKITQSFIEDVMELVNYYRMKFCDNNAFNYWDAQCSLQSVITQLVRIEHLERKRKNKG